MHEFRILPEYAGKNTISHYVLKSRNHSLINRIIGGGDWHTKFLSLELKQPTGPVATYTNSEVGDDKAKRIFLSVNNSTLLAECA